MVSLPEDPVSRDWERPVSGGPVRFAVVGIGQFARECLIPAFEQTNQSVCRVLVTETPNELADSDRTVIDYDTYHDGGAAEEYDAVYVATPNHTHERIVETATAHGKHVLCEKPMAATLEQAKSIRRACEDSEIALMIGNRVQFKPTIRYVRDVINDGFLGEPVHIHGGTSFDVFQRGGTDQWRLDADAGGGALLDIGIYVINTIRFLFGEKLAVQSASMATTEEIQDVDAHVEFTLGVNDGGTASCTASFQAHPASHLRLVGTDGVVHIEAVFRPYVEPTVSFHRGTTHRTVDAERFDEYSAQLDYFSQCILRDERPEPGGEEGVADMELIADIKSCL